VLFKPPGGAGLPYEAIIPAFANIQVIIKVDPMRRGTRRPHLSMNTRAKIVITTFITYWIEEATKLAFPDRPAMPNTYLEYLLAHTALCTSGSR
jgi:uncharacterized membrane protein YozB (DUF420 family)